MRHETKLIALVVALILAGPAAVAHAAEEATPAPAATPPQLESIRFVAHKDSGELLVRLSSPLAKPATVRRAAGFVTFVLPGAGMKGRRRGVEASDELFDLAWAVARKSNLLVAVRPKDAALADRSRIEAEGKLVRIRMFRSDEAAKAADAVRELEGALDAAPSGSNISKIIDMAPAAPGDGARAKARTPAAPPTLDARGPDTSAHRQGGSAPPASVTSAPASGSSPLLAAVGAKGLGGATSATGGSPFTVRMWAAFGMILFVIVGALWFMRRNRQKGGKSGSPIRILTAQSIAGGKRHLLLVDVHGERLLLGSAEGGISLLARIEDPDADVALEDDDANVPAGARVAARRVGQGVASRSPFFARLRDALFRKSPHPFASTLRTASASAGAAAFEGELAERSEPRPTARESRGAVASQSSGATPASADVRSSGPAWTVALSGQGAKDAGETAAATADLIRRKLAELKGA
jgi:flagellar biogenesis protein FliO